MYSILFFHLDTMASLIHFIFLNLFYHLFKCQKSSEYKVFLLIELFYPTNILFFLSTTSTTSIISDCNWTQTHNHLVHKQTLNHLANYRAWIHSETSMWDDKNIQTTSIILMFLCITRGTNFMQVLKSKWQDLTLISTYDLSSEFL